MAPHRDNHSAPLNVAKNNAAKRDLQSAMQNAPQVRVIHIFAPRVIKTDVANFRSTVQKLTGRSKRRASRAAKADHATVTTTPSNDDGLQGLAPYPGGLWEKEELQRLVGDACGGSDLVRCTSVDSGSYSLDSGNTVFSGDSSGVDTSPTDSFSFYPQRETPYSLTEITAPFFTLQPHDLLHASPSMPLSIPEHTLLESHNMSMLGFDVDSVGTLPLPDVVPLGCSSISSSSSGGSLFDLPRHHCRLSVQQPFQGANFFESM